MPPDNQSNPEQPQPSVPQPAPPQEQAVQEAPQKQLPNEQSLGLEDIAAKKQQARTLRVLAVLSGIVVVACLAVLTVLLLRSDSEPQLSIDEQLERDLNTFALGVNNFRNGSNYFTLAPEDVGEFRVTYLPPAFEDPRTNQAYTLTTAIPEVGEIQYIVGGTCNQDDSISQTGDNTKFAARVQLENGTLLCLQESEINIPSEPQP